MLDHHLTDHEAAPSSSALDTLLADRSSYSGISMSAGTFRRVSAAIIGLSSLVLLRLVVIGSVGASYQGDEGARIFDAYQTAFGYPNNLYGSIWGHASETFFGVHPPGDNIVRSSVAWLLDLVGLDLNPVTAMFVLSIVTVGVAHYIAANIAFQSGGTAAGALTLFLLFGSFVFNDIKVSSMGEAIAMPLLLGGIHVVLAAVNEPSERHLRTIAVGAFLVALSTFVRPEPSLFLPGLCLALWYLVGFPRAALFGAIAGLFEIAKLIDATFFASDEELSVLNVGSKYFNGTKTFGTLWKSDFVQQLVSEPAVLIFPVGMVASVLFAGAIGRRSDRAWRAHLLVFAGTVSYLGVNIGAQLTGLAPHASYRVAIASGPTMIIGFSVAFVGLARILRPWVEERLGDEPAKLVALCALVLACGWGAYDFFTDEVSALTARVPDGVRLSADEVLARSEPEDAVYFDRMRYWENGLLGYFANRDAPVCNYARCSTANDAANEFWGQQRSDRPVVGTTTWGEFNALRMHAFISESQPSHIVVANEGIYNDWTRLAGGLWGDEAELWASHIVPYMDGDIDYRQPKEQFLRLGDINDVEYFEEYVYLIPRSRNDVGIIYEAFYGRVPEDAQ